MKLTKQAEYCKSYQIPMFAPLDGVCWHCRGIIKDSNKELITGCKKCNHSFCE